VTAGSGVVRGFLVAVAPGDPDQGRGGASGHVGGDQGPVGGHQRLLGGVSSSCEPLEISSKSSCAFPMIPRATSVIPKRRYVTASWRRRRTISACSGVNRPIFTPGFLPARTPTSRSLRHTVIWDE